jgi:hypothetical protein
LFELGHGAAGVALGLWGWSRLCRAKAARPDLSWWQFLHVDLIALVSLLVMFAVLATISMEQLKSLLDALLELAHLISMAKGQPY